VSILLSTSIDELTVFFTQVRNEIAVLKKISSGHRNIVTLHDYFEVGYAARLAEIYMLILLPQDITQSLPLL
jgi:hypothetical protein